MATTASSFYAKGSSNPTEVTGVTAWSRPSGNVPFDYGVSGIGLQKGVIGVIDDGTLAPKFPGAGGYTAKAGILGGANTDTGAAGASTASVGVFGQSGDVTGLSAGWGCGVLGASAGKPGVIGWSSKSQGVYGLLGTAPAIDPKTDFTKVIGGVVGASKDACGVVGVSQTNAGVLGRSRTVGAWGWADQLGVVGNADEDLGGVGVTGNVGQYGPTPPNANGAGVWGTSANNPGVLGSSQAQIGVYGFSVDYPGVQGVSTNHAGVYGQSTNDFAAYFAGDVFVTGTLSATTKNAVVAFPDGSRRVLHCMESPEHWFEDFGAARLKNGRATVKLDADFAKMIKRGDYHVFLTPEGDCRGLYVRRKIANRFEVRELMGGKSAIAFCYRIVGRRKDIKGHKRFAKIDVRALRPPRAPRGRKQAPSLPAMRALLDTLEKRRPTSKTARTRRRPKRLAS